ncbi:putative baseplate assembly protein [Pseudomonas alcaligenes]|uniref:Baseplate assembly protein n=1 Tax=Aquipseudomonas alcaligenes TaxID=43263 RepID=A0ABR7S4Z3_AQUAC|nr:putative baseplate assembly protein [Pseudomonas alcaligenes]MBC9251671.1 putative baseplate assembly protein [Pseudomonas alcaligenes]
MSTSDCGCCSGIQAQTPVDGSNPPGQTELRYRVGSHGRFRDSLLAALARQPALQALTTRAADDPALALLDAWSGVLDVLSFYQERIINEGFLRTASERRSILELGRAIGYELRPGVAASTFLAFTLETAPGAPAESFIAAGCKSQSVPAQDEKPQVFETLEDLQARAAWNALQVLSQDAVRPYWGGRTIYLKGQNTQLQPGDALLVVGEERRKTPGNENWDFRRVRRLLLVPPDEPSADPQAGYTVVTLDRPFGSVAPPVQPSQVEPRCYALRSRAALFGQAAPNWKAMPRSVRAAYAGLAENAEVPFATYPNWPDFSISGVSGSGSARGPQIHLDGSYPKMVAGSWVVLAVPDYEEVYEVLENAEDARVAFTLGGKATRLTLSGENLSDQFNSHLRDTAVYGESVELAWASRPRSGLVEGNLLHLASLQPDLEAGRWLALSGLSIPATAAHKKVLQRLRKGDHLAAVQIERDGRHGRISFADGKRYEVELQAVAEVVRIRRNDNLDGLTRLELESALSQVYLPASLRINANVAPASHGDSRQMRIQAEILGSGDGSSAFQRFQLQQKPLTYVSAATPSGTASSLQVWVDGVLWHEAPQITALGPQDSAYLLRRADDGTTSVQFGDGQTGRRLPSGQMNVEASYRVGIGVAGNLPAGQISLLLNRPLGLKDVLNPVPASGGADPESRDQARRNAPLTVLALERIVSLRDFEDFASAFAGIGKAQAVWLWNGEGRLVHLTVIGLDGAAIASDSALYRNLAAAIDQVRPAHQPLRLDAGVRLGFGLSAKLRVQADHVAETVLAAVRAALAEAFGFAARGYGQSLSGSEVVAVMQGVAGVERVDLDQLRLHGGNGGSVAGPDGRLRARGARWENGQIRPAQLLLVDLDDVLIEELSA